MPGVILGHEQFVVAHSNLNRTTDEGMWRFNFPYRHYETEVLLPGDEVGPSAEWLSLAGRVCAQADQFVAAAIDCFRGFIEPSWYAPPREWSLEWLEFGRGPHQERRAFELIFVLDDDVYGGWGVLFVDTCGPSGYWPEQFRRFQR